MKGVSNVITLLVRSSCWEMGNYELTMTKVAFGELSRVATIAVTTVAEFDVAHFLDLDMWSPHGNLFRPGIIEY